MSSLYVVANIHFQDRVQIIIYKSLKEIFNCIYRTKTIPLRFRMETKYFRPSRLLLYTDFNCFKCRLHTVLQNFIFQNTLNINDNTDPSVTALHVLFNTAMLVIKLRNYLT
jgi:hypothetical protein